MKILRGRFSSSLRSKGLTCTHYDVIACYIFYVHDVFTYANTLFSSLSAPACMLCGLDVCEYKQDRVGWFGNQEEVDDVCCVITLRKIPCL